MSRCLCCGKTLCTETEHGWHTSCVKNFFGTSKFPDIDVSKEVLNQIAIEGIYSAWCSEKNIFTFITRG